MADEKLILRKQVRSRRAQISVADREARDARIISRVLNWDVYRQASTVFLYVGVKNEISTKMLIEHAYQQGKAVALPKCFENGVMHFYRYNGLLRDGMYGIPEPISDDLCIPAESDLMIVPGLAFDPFGYRLGQGGGFYDRYLSIHKNVITAGVCGKEFLFERIPEDWNDLPVDFVITEDELFECKEKRSF